MSDGSNGGVDAPDGEGAPDVNTLIMEATYRALCEHGYAELSVSHIAAEFEKSKSLLYYHYDSKDDLLAGFLRFAGDHFLAMLDEAEREADSPVDRVRSFVDIYLGAELDEEMAEAQRAMIDLRAQAVAEPRFREEFTRIDRHLRERLATALADGVEAGVVDDAVDPEPTATWLLSALSGAMLQRHTADYDVVTPVRTLLHGYVDHYAVNADSDGE
ncbi:TetR/AcrR family transcriptional regulator [Halobaculum magnesiiphilum]|uniref:TetR/AcrR family transcriptional regulator n=1 Tax=Halobaculum magnesiiphilum TaxID=1017351 RepID=A0A8T8W9I8_9EURY|nr:TetR/AcrR family transcriptional regulator [Halobaculum magnesiiphilum]QZP36444.1 TetR/AcrR family transcriptional regulator [Halobaculum magnesiiphilum]